MENMPPEIEVFELGARRLYAKTSGGTFAMFEDDLTPEELIAIARDISARKAELSLTTSTDNASPSC